MNNIISNNIVNILLLISLLTVSVKCNNNNEDKEKLLSRRRRYLIFPSGSSVQMVYDQIITVVDYTNLFIVGVTTSLAWELPDKPTYVDEELMAQYENATGTLPLLQRNDQNASDNIYADNNNPQDTYYKSNGYNELNPKYDNYYNDKKYYDRYYKNNYNSKEKMKYYSDNNRMSYDDKLINQINKYADKPHQPWSQSSWEKTVDRDSSIPQRPKTPKRKHLIYPAIGKRSISGTSRSFEEQFYMNHHRATRQNLYKLIEKYLKAYGKNGEECVRKALCETGQKRTDNEPGTFIGEIMRVVFSLPVPTLGSASSRNKYYDDAYNAQKNCTALYPKCSHSIWESDFIF